MANNRETTAHVVMQLIREGVRDALKAQSAAPALTGSTFAGFLGGTPAGQTMDGAIGAPTSQAGSGAGSSGLDYAVWPLAGRVYATFDDRFANLEQFVAMAYAAAMRGDPGTGHQHSGANGDAPPLPALSVLLPAGHVGVGATLADHLTDASLHWGTARGLVFDDFEAPDQDSRWEVRAGTPVRDATGGNTRWHLPAGTVLRIKDDPGYSFNQKISVRFDLAFDAAAADRRFEVRYRVRPDATRFTYLAGFSASEDCYLAELDNSTNTRTVTATGGRLPNDGLMWTYEATLGHTDFRADLGDVLHQTLSTTIPRYDGYDQGYLELYAVGAVWLDNVLVARAASASVAPHAPQHALGGSDPLDVSDLADRNGALAPGGTPGQHAPTHRAGGSDPLDVGDLLDASGTRLSPTQKNALVLGGSADGYHSHTGLLLLETTVTPPAVARQPILGSSAHAARADHSHAAPHWDLDWYLSADFTAGYLVTDADFDTSPRATVRQSFHPTLAGEFRYTGYGRNLYLRAQLKVRNASADRAVSFLVPALAGTLSVRLRNTAGDLLLYSRSAGINRANETFGAVLKGGEVNTLVVLGGADTDWWAFHLAVTSDGGDLLGSAQNLFYTP